MASNHEALNERVQIMLFILLIPTDFSTHLSIWLRHKTQLMPSNLMHYNIQVSITPNTENKNEIVREHGKKEDLGPSCVVSNSNMKNLYWSSKQQLVHHRCTHTCNDINRIKMLLYFLLHFGIRDAFVVTCWNFQLISYSLHGLWSVWKQKRM